MKITDLFQNNKFNEIKQSHSITKSKNKKDSNIHSLMLLSNPFVSSQIKSKYSSIISNAVNSFLDHNPRERDISNNLHSFQLGNLTSKKLKYTKQAITNFLNSSTQQKKSQLNISKKNDYIHGPNLFDKLKLKSGTQNYPKKTHRSSSNDESVNIMKKIRDFTSTISKPSNMASTNRLALLKDDNINNNKCNEQCNRFLINSSSFGELNHYIKNQFNVHYNLNKGHDHITDVQLNNKENENHEQCNTLSSINDFALTDKLNIKGNNNFYLSSIIKEDSINESDTFLSLKSYLLLNTPN